MPTSSHPSIAKLQREVREWFPSLSRAQANVLGEMAYAMLMTDGCGMTRMSSYMAELLGQPMNTLRQKYREIYYEKEAKAGVKNQQKKRREIVPEELFADLLRGVLKGWEGEKTLVLALDASALGDRFTVLSISVMYRGCGMRVAWTMQEGHQAGEWRPHWERMLRQLADVVPAEWTVLVMADRGLYAAWLYQAIQTNGWHPFLRVKKDLSFRAQGEEAFGTIGGRVKRTGREWKGTGEWSEKGDRMGGTVLVRWEQGYEEAICVVSDLPAEEARTAWYQMRFWIEDEYKDGKRGWFHWEQTKMTNPQRASRLWLVLGLVLQKAIVLGGQLEAEEQKARQRSKRRQSGPKRRRGRPALPQGRPRGREQSVLLRGIMALRASESGGKRLLPNGQVRAEPLPARRRSGTNNVPRPGPGGSSERRSGRPNKLPSRCAGKKNTSGGRPNKPPSRRAGWRNTSSGWLNKPPSRPTERREKPPNVHQSTRAHPAHNDEKLKQGPKEARRAR